MPRAQELYAVVDFGGVHDFYPAIRNREICERHVAGKGGVSRGAFVDHALGGAVFHANVGQIALQRQVFHSAASDRNQLGTQPPTGVSDGVLANGSHAKNACCRTIVRVTAVDVEKVALATRTKESGHFNIRRSAIEQRTNPRHVGNTVSNVDSGAAVEQVGVSRASIVVAHTFATTLGDGHISAKLGVDSRTLAIERAGTDDLKADYEPGAQARTKLAFSQAGEGAALDGDVLANQGVDVGQDDMDSAVGLGDRLVQRDGDSADRDDLDDFAADFSSRTVRTVGFLLVFVIQEIPLAHVGWRADTGHGDGARTSNRGHDGCA